MLDLATKQLEAASKEILSMGAIKKEIVYNLGLVYEQMGDREKSLACCDERYHRQRKDHLLHCSVTPVPGLQFPEARPSVRMGTRSLRYDFSFVTRITD